ncbi:MAG: tetratricopeptide repeat protein [bacterium]|nr:tetratricopeptide repeat protein [bacterium]
MKKVLISIFIIMFAISGYASAKSYYNAQTSAAIKMYKNKNYTECLQVMYDVVDKDPSNVLAYYYIAIANARLGKTDKAKEAYERVLEINSSTQLSNLSKNGIECLEDNSKCKGATSINPTEKAMEAVNQQMQDQKLNSIKNLVNQKNSVQEVPVDYLRGLKDYSLPENQQQNKSEAPTNEEILAALDTLKRAGYQNYMPQPAMTQEMMQLSMLNSLNGNNNQNYNNSMAGFLPYMMNSNTDMSQIDPQVLQTMMMGSMMNGLYTNFDQ